MSAAFVKKYPRAKVSRHSTLDGWVIDILQRAGAKPRRVSATYASIPWAHKASRLKLGLKPVAPVLTPAPAKGFELFESKQAPPAATNAGTCDTCKRPMRAVGTRVSDHPGTTLRQRAGLCQGCNVQATRGAR